MKLISLLYHQIDPVVDARNSVKPIAFAAQLDVLNELGFQCIRPNDVPWIDRSETSRPLLGVAVLITFDDAYCGAISHALPILKEHSIPALMFVPTKYVGGNNNWNTKEEFTAAHASWDDLSEWMAAGSFIGSHSHSHFNMKRLSSTAIIDELFTAKDILRQRLGVVDCPFAYPYGEFTSEIASAVRQEHAAAFAVDKGGWDWNTSLDGINRLLVRGSWTVSEFRQRVMEVLQCR